MAQNQQVSLAKKLEILHQQVHSYAHDLETIMAGLEEHQNSHSIEYLHDTIKGALSDLESLYGELKGDGESDETLSEVFHRAHL
ncbi:hypothetical protein [Piscibacillus salipiscarius]|uniref:Uncharacterized protein n=1 Tax=Piscibacillus salipiscarius TaxID=299480 RepID=A0ABW5Q8Z1_9BACI